jgi:proteasome lid subunit RPN8/RPN11
MTTIETRPKLRIPASILSAMDAHGETGYPDEIVGVLIGREVSAAGVASGEIREVTEARRLENTRLDNRARRYTVDPLALAKIERECDAAGLLVLGFYHSHPDHPAQPSQTDLEWAWPVYSYVIQSIQKGKASTRTSWRLSEDEKSFFEEDIETL